MADTIGIKLGVEGEKEFKKALSDINQNMKVLGSEMKLAASEFDKNEKSVASLTAKNQVLNKQIDEQKGKIETLEKALKNASDSFGENDKRTQSWQVQLNNAKAALNDMERELQQNNDEINSLSDEMNGAEKDTKKFSDAIDKSGEQAENAGGKFEKVGSAVKKIGAVMATAVAAIGTAAVAAGKAVWNMANDTAAAGDEIDKMSQKIGISAEAYQKWAYVFERSGTDVNNLQSGMKTLSTVITDAANGSASAAEKLSAVGLSIEELNGKTQEQQLDAVIAALQNMGEGSERTAAATDLLGKSATDLGAVLNMTAKETAALKQEAENYGMIMSDEAVKASAAFEDSLTKLQSTFSGFKNSITSEMLPALTTIMDGFSDLIAGNEGAAQSIQNGVTSLINNISGMLPQFTQLISSIAVAVMESAPSIIKSLADGIISSMPVILPTVSNIMLEIVSALVELLPQLADAGMQIIVTLMQGIADAIPTLVPQIVAVITQITQTLIDNLPLLLDAALQLITGLAQGLLDALPVLIEALPSIITAIVEFIIGAIPQLIQAGIQLLTALVGALPEIITAVVEAIPQIIDGVINALIESIPLIIQAGIDLFIALIQNLPTIITTIVEAIPKIIDGVVNGIFGNLDKIIMAGVELFVSLIANLPTIIVEIVKAVPKIIEGLVNAFGGLIGKIAEVGGNLVSGLWEGISGAASWLWDQVSGWLSGLWDGICGFFGIASPSKEMAWVGKMLADGLAGGIEKNSKEAVNAAKDMSKNINSVMTNLADDMQTTIPTDFTVNAKATGTVGKAQNIGAYDTGTASEAASAGPLFTVSQMIVRSDDDIRKVSQDLYNLIQVNSRAQGRAVTA